MNGMRIVMALLLTALLGAAAAGSSTSSATATACRGTLPNHAASGPAFSRSQFNYGGANLRAHLNWKNGTLRAGILPDGGAMATINDDGSIYTKQGWWRGRKGLLVVTGRRLDGPAPPMHGGVRPGYAETGFIPVTLTFPTTGCWRITGILGKSRLTYTVKVTKLQAEAQAFPRRRHAGVRLRGMCWGRDARPAVSSECSDETTDSRSHWSATD